MASRDQHKEKEEEQRPVTRVACFKFREEVSAEVKGGRTRAFLALYEEHEELLLERPRGGRPLNTPLNLTDVKRETEWDTLFIVVFKSDATRKEFDSGEGHDRLKEETDRLLSQVFVYDFLDEEGLGW